MPCSLGRNGPSWAPPLSTMKWWRDWAYAGNHGCLVFMAAIAMSCVSDSISRRSSPSPSVNSFYFLFCDAPQALGDTDDINVPFGATPWQLLNFSALYVSSALTVILCKRDFFCSRFRGTLAYGYKYKYLEDNLSIYPLRDTTVVCPPPSAYEISAFLPGL